MKKTRLIHSPFLCDAGNTGICFCYIQLVNAYYEARVEYLSGVATRIIIIISMTSLNSQRTQSFIFVSP